MSTVDRRRFLALAAAAGSYGALAGAQPSSRSVPTSKDRSARTAIQFIDVNGTRLGYERHAARGGSRRPLVFVHGYALRSTGDIYALLFKRLTAEFDVYALDLRGHGASARSFANWSQAAVADDAAAFADKLKLRGAVYAGHSFGGFTGMLAQIRHPGTFSALILLATAPASGDPPPPGAMKSFVKSDRAQMQKLFAGMFLHPGSDDIRRAVDSVSLIDPSVHIANDVSNVISERLNQIRVPVLLINGGKDSVVSPIKQHATALGIPLSKEVIFSSEGHMIPIEASETTAREMINFFRYDLGATFKT